MTKKAVNNKPQEPAPEPEPKLLSTTEGQYGKESYKEHILEQYKLCVDMADKNSERRSNSNTFYLSLVSALIAIIGVLSQVETPISNLYFWWVALVSFSGIIFCLLWHDNILCYRELSSAKFKVINEMEETLPVKAFVKEWYHYKKEGKNELTLVERKIPWIFVAVFGVLLLVSLIVANFNYVTGVRAFIKTTFGI